MCADASSDRAATSARTVHSHFVWQYQPSVSCLHIEPNPKCLPTLLPVAAGLINCRRRFLVSCSAVVGTHPQHSCVKFLHSACPLSLSSNVAAKPNMSGRWLVRITRHISDDGDEAEFYQTFESKVIAAASAALVHIHCMVRVVCQAVWTLEDGVLRSVHSADWIGQGSRKFLYH